MMSRKSLLIISIISLFAMLIVSGCKNRTPQPNAKIRLGWLGGWFPQAQLVQTFKHTDIADHYRIALNFDRFQDTDSLISAAVGDELDAVWISPFGAMQLLDRNPHWMIISRCANDRISLYVPPASRVKRLRDLQDRTIGVPAGSETHALLLDVIEKQGFKPGIDIRLRNYNVEKQLSTIKKGATEKWAHVSALANDACKLAAMETAGKVRSLDIGIVPSLLMVSPAMAQEHPDRVIALLEAMMEAHLYSGKHPEKTVPWTLSAVKNLNAKTLKLCDAAEPNARALLKGEVSLHLSDPNVSTLQLFVNYLHDKEMLNEEFNVENFIDRRLLQRAEEDWWNDGNFTPSVTVE